MSEEVAPTTEALKEALSLSSEILRNIELSEIPLTNIVLKASRLARLLNEYDMQKIMEFEASGYPSSPAGIPPDIWRLAGIAGRQFEVAAKKPEDATVLAFVESIAEWEQIVDTAGKAIEAAREPDVSIVSANPYQHVYAPLGHGGERQAIRTSASTAARRIAERQSFIYGYVLRKHYELKFSGIADDIFSRVRERVDASIGDYVPEAVQKLSAIHDNLRSQNAEDWSNAVHSCRRILQDLADVVFGLHPYEWTEEVRRVWRGRSLFCLMNDW